MGSQKRIEELMLNAEGIKRHQEELNAEYRVTIQLIEEELRELGLEEFTLDDGSEKILKVQIRQRTSITYDLNTLRRLIPRELLKLVIQRSVDAKRLEALFESGQININQVAPAAHVSESESTYLMRVKR